MERCIPFLQLSHFLSSFTIVKKTINCNLPFYPEIGKNKKEVEKGQLKKLLPSGKVATWSGHCLTGLTPSGKPTHDLTET